MTGPAGLPWGDWATWATALFTLLAFGGVLFALYVENRNRRADIERLDAQRREDQLGAQAHQVDAWIDRAEWQFGDLHRPTRNIYVYLRFANASPQAVRSGIAELIYDTTHNLYQVGTVAPNGGSQPNEMRFIFVMPDGYPYGMPPDNLLGGLFKSAFAFTDAGGYRWDRRWDGTLSCTREGPASGV